MKSDEIYMWSTIIRYCKLELRDCSEFLVRGGGVWAMAGVQGKVAFGLSHFCILSFSKKV